MKAALAGKPVNKFHMPAGMTVADIDLHTGMASKPGTSGADPEPFKPGTGPAEVFSTVDETETSGATSSEIRRAMQPGAVGLF